MGARVELKLIFCRDRDLCRCAFMFSAGEMGGRERDREKKKHVLVKTFIKVSSSLRTVHAGSKVIKEMREED